jgi:predicted dehydrogenase
VPQRQDPKAIRHSLTKEHIMIRIGVIGYGYWGPNLVRNFSIPNRSQVIAVSDLNYKRLEEVNRLYPHIKTTTHYQELIADTSIDAIAIATPVSTHYELSLSALRANKHVFVEKPLTQTSDQGKRLIEEAQKRQKVLMVDHTFLYTGAVRKIRELIMSGELGEIYYYDSIRVNLGLFQNDVDVIWDLAVHDLSIIDYVTSQKPIAISATGISHVKHKPCNVAYLTLFYANNMIAHINVNWLSPVKLRQILIGGSKKMLLYDDVEPSEKIKIYDRGIDIPKDAEEVYKALVKYRMGDMWSPQLSNHEALLLEANEFLDCIASKKTPTTDGMMGLRLVGQLEAATESMQLDGVPINLKEVEIA